MAAVGGWRGAGRAEAGRERANGAGARDCLVEESRRRGEALRGKWRREVGADGCRPWARLGGPREVEGAGEAA